MNQQSTTLGILCILGAFACFSTQDMLFKWLSPHYAIPAVQLIRIAFSVCITLLILLPLEARAAGLSPREALTVSQPAQHWLRSLFIFIANMCFFVGLAVNDIGVHVAIFFISPLILTALSVLFLGESVGWRRWSAVAVGLVGAFLIIKPTPNDFNPMLLLPLGAAIFHALTQMTTRRLGRTERAAPMSVSAQLTWIVLAVPMFVLFSTGNMDPGPESNFHALFRAWGWPSGEHMWMLGGIIVLSTLGGFLVSQGYRMIPASTAAQYEYVALPMGVMWGMMIWGERPDILTWAGIGLIGGAGLYVFYRERIKRQKA